MSTETELAWAAGFFDGEGNTAISKKASNNRAALAQVQITQAGSPELLERFAQATGVGKVTGPYEYKKRKPNNQPFWKYTISSLDGVKYVFEQLSPYLGKIKSRQFIDTIRYVEDSITNRIYTKGRYNVKKIDRDVEDLERRISTVVGELPVFGGNTVTEESYNKWIASGDNGTDED